ncbi:hypothetical protein BH24GEM3_BH24GEM3_08620 [soil metagenome]
MTRFRGLVWRHVPVGAVPLHLGWILKASRGRWNSQRPRLPCLSTSLVPEGAVAEFEKHLAEYRAPRRRDLVSIQVSVGPVLNLTSPRNLRRLGIDPNVLTGDRPSDLVACRAIAREHVLHGSYRAILAPSAALQSAIDLMIYIERTHGIAELHDGPDRITVLPGYRGPFS